MEEVEEYYVIYFPLFMGKVEKHKRCSEEKTKQYFYLPLFIFSVKKELQAKCGLRSPKLWAKFGYF